MIAGFACLPIHEVGAALREDGVVGLGVVLRLGISGAKTDDLLVSALAGGLGVVDLVGTSGARLMVGTIGAVAACSSGGGPDLFGFRGRGVNSGRADTSSFSSMMFQSFLKETIGRPGASETAVGVGSFGLRSFKRNPVAARSSSLLISLPSFIFTSGTFSTSALAGSAGFASPEFSV